MPEVDPIRVDLMVGDKDGTRGDEGFTKGSRGKALLPPLGALTSQDKGGWGKELAHCDENDAKPTLGLGHAFTKEGGGDEEKGKEGDLDQVDHETV